MALEIRHESVGDILVLDLKGRLDTDTAADLELAVQDHLQAGARDFIINLSGVGYVSSAGLRVLLMLGKGVDGKGSLRLAGLNPTVRQVFDVAGFTQLFTILPNREAALAQKIKTSAIKPATSRPEVAKPVEEKPQPAKPAVSKPEAAKPEAINVEPTKPAPAKPAESTPKESSADLLAARVAKVLGIDGLARPSVTMPADQVSRVALALARGGR